MIAEALMATPAISPANQENGANVRASAGMNRSVGKKLVKFGVTRSR